MHEIVARLARQGRSQAEIARTLGVSRQRIHQIVVKNEIRFRPRRDRKRPVPPEIPVQAVTPNGDGITSTMEIRRLFGPDTRLVEYWSREVIFDWSAEPDLIGSMLLDSDAIDVALALRARSMVKDADLIEFAVFALAHPTAEHFMICVSANPTRRLQKVRSLKGGLDVTIAAMLWVYGRKRARIVERAARDLAACSRADDEWFALNRDDVAGAIARAAASIHVPACSSAMMARNWINRVGSLRGRRGNTVPDDTAFDVMVARPNGHTKPVMPAGGGKVWWA